jgi:hypothetical protein
MSGLPLTEKQVTQFSRDGYLVVPNLLDDEEVGMLSEAVRADSAMQNASMDVRDSKGRRTNLSLWNHPGDDIYGAIARSESVVGSMEAAKSTTTTQSLAPRSQESEARGSGIKTMDTGTRMGASFQTWQASTSPLTLLLKKTVVSRCCEVLI